MALNLEITDDLLAALHLPQGQEVPILKLELACALYRADLLSLGKAAELAGVNKFTFGAALGERGISRHYTSEELEQDLRYARGEQHVSA